MMRVAGRDGATNGSVVRLGGHDEAKGGRNLNA